MAKEKQLTKGQKQIYEENSSSMRFYLIMTSIAAVLHFATNYFLFYQSTSTNSWIFFVISVLGELGSLKCMQFMAKTIRSETGQILDAGIDLNMVGGFGEYCKDIIILSSLVQLLSIISVWFWSLYLTAPLFATYKLWTSIISPWVFAPAPDGDGDRDGQKNGEKGGKRGKQRAGDQPRFKNVRM